MKTGLVKMFFFIIYKSKAFVANLFLVLHVTPKINEYEISTKLNQGLTLSYKLKGYRHFRDYYNSAEIETWNFLASDLSGGGAIIDVGANVGQFSLVVSKIFESRHIAPPRLLCFEPMKSNFELLSVNFASNLIVGELYNFAIGENSGKENLVIHEIYGRRKFKGVIKIYSLDSLISQLNLESVELLKIDTDGFEINVLKGAKNFLNFYRPKILIEVNAKVLTKKGLDPSVIEEQLNLLGYRKKSVFDNENALFIYRP